MASISKGTAATVPASLLAGLVAAATAGAKTAATDAGLVAAATAVLPVQLHGLMAAAVSASAAPRLPVVDAVNASTTVSLAGLTVPSIGLIPGKAVHLILDPGILALNLELGPRSVLVLPPGD